MQIHEILYQYLNSGKGFYFRCFVVQCPLPDLQISLLRVRLVSFYHFWMLVVLFCHWYCFFHQLIFSCHSFLSFSFFHVESLFTSCGTFNLLCACYLFSFITVTFFVFLFVTFDLIDRCFPVRVLFFFDNNNIFFFAFGVAIECLLMGNSIFFSIIVSMTVLLSVFCFFA